MRQVGHLPGSNIWVALETKRGPTHLRHLLLSANMLGKHQTDTQTESHLT